MPRTESLHFSSPPSIWGLYPRILAARKGALVREGGAVPRLVAQLDPVRVPRARLAQYRQLVGAEADGPLPPAFPHILASPLHLALLSSPRFPVRLLGLVHVRNRIEQFGPLPLDGGGIIEVSIEGHEETDRGQEFDLQTRWLLDEQPIWRESTIFLARRKGGARAGGASPGREQRVELAPRGAAVQTASFRADAGIGRSYGLASGDVNPIHLSDLSARAFGFRGAIAHGMWSLARCATQLQDAIAELEHRFVLEVQFKLPVFLPAWLLFERWAESPGRTAFALRDTQGEKLHLSGTLQPAR